MDLAEITESIIEDYADDEIIERGRLYARQGRVTDIVRRGDALDADVEGSDVEPYRVHIAVDGDGVEATCTCLYDWGGWCKHIVATLLAYQDDPGRVEARPPLTDVLAPLAPDALRGILLKLAARHPHLTEEIETLLASRGAAAPSAGTAGVTVDQRTIRREMRAVMHGLDDMSASEAYWHVGGMMDAAREMLEPAWEFIRAGDGRNALAVLEPITDEAMRSYDEIDDSNGEVGDFFTDLGAAWTEAFLTVNLGPDERARWTRTLESWQEEVADYGMDTAFLAAAAAAREGWDDPALVRILSGDAPTLPDEDGDDEGHRSWYAESLVNARLNVLERQGRMEEARRLAVAEGLHARHACILARVGRTGEALSEALSHLTLPGEVLAAARALQEAGDTAAALRLGAHGLAVPEPKPSEIDWYSGVQRRDRRPLGLWLRDLALANGDASLAADAATAALLSRPSLDEYRRLREIAGDGWPARRDAVLESLRNRFASTGTIDILLDEQLWDDALGAVRDGMSGELTARVVDAVWDKRPEEVIPICRRHADIIMDCGKAAAYDEAAQWLIRARDAMRLVGREEEWDAYLADLKARHARKYKLMPLLKGL